MKENKHKRKKKEKVKESTHYKSEEDHDFRSYALGEEYIQQHSEMQKTDEAKDEEE